MTVVNIVTAACMLGWYVATVMSWQALKRRLAGADQRTAIRACTRWGLAEGAGVALIIGGSMVVQAFVDRAPLIGFVAPAALAIVCGVPAGLGLGAVVYIQRPKTGGA